MPNLSQTVDFNVSRGVAAMNSLVDVLNKYNTTIDKVSKAEGKNFSAKSGAAKALDIEIQVSATKKLIVAMELEKNKWTAKAEAIESTTDALKKHREEEARLIQLMSNKQNIGTNTGVVSGPGFFNEDQFRAEQKRAEEHAKILHRVQLLANQAKVTLAQNLSTEELRIELGTLQTILSAKRKAAQQQIADQRALFQTVHALKMAHLDILRQEKEIEAEVEKRARIARIQKRANTIDALRDVNLVINGQQRLLTYSNNMTVQQIANERKVLNTVLDASKKVHDARIQGIADTVKQILILAGGMRSATSAANQFALSISQIVRIAQFALFYSQIYRLINAFREGTQEAIEFERRIGEIQTLSQKTGESALFWSNSLRQLSDQMGNPILDTAEGVYEAISNQIVEGGTNTRFFANEMKLALITVSKFEDAVNATSSVINSFNYSANDANYINAILFKTIDLGRIRLSELADTLGRVNTLSEQLGITFEEQQAALSVLTIAGLKNNVAQTLYTNVLQRMIRPTERMKEIFADWGVTSGEAAIKTFGFTNVLLMLEKVAKSGGDELAEIGEIMQRVRAISGFSVLNADRMNMALGEMKNAAGEANKAFDLINENIGQKARVELNKIKNLFVVDYGQKILKDIILVSERFGGLKNVVATLVDVVYAGARAYGVYRLAAIGANAVLLVQELRTIAASRATVTATVKLNAYKQAVDVCKAAGISFNAVMGNVSGVLIALAVEGYIYASQQAERFAQAVQDAADKAREASDKTTTAMVDDFIAGLRKRSDAFNSAMNSELKLVRGVMAILRQQNTELATDLEQTFKQVAESLDDVVKPATNNINEVIKDTEKNIQELTRSIEKSKDLLLTNAERKDANNLDARVEAAATEEEKILLIHNEALMKRRQAEQALLDDRLEDSEKFTKRAEQLEQQALDRVDKLRNNKPLDRDENARLREQEALQKKLINLEIAYMRLQEDKKVTRSERATFQKKQAEIRAEIAALDERDAGILEREEQINRATNARKVIEQEITAEQDKRQKQLEDFQKRQEAALQKQEADLKKRQEAAEIFKREIEDVTKFKEREGEKPTDMLTRFDVQAEEALNAAQNAGVDPASYLEMVTQLAQQRKAIELEIEREINKDKLDQAQKMQNELEQQLETAQKARDNLLAEGAGNQKKFLDESAATIAMIEQLLAALPQSKDSAVQRAGGERIDEIKKKIIELRALERESTEARKGGNNELADQKLREAQETYRQILILQRDLTLRLQPEKTGLNANYLPVDRAGNPVLNNKDGEKTIQEKLFDLQQQIALTDELKKKEQEIIALDAQLLGAVKAIVASLPEEQRLAAQAAIDSARTQVEASKSIVAAMQEIVRSINEVIDAQNRMGQNKAGANLPDPNRAMGGIMQSFATGGVGRGADTMLGNFRPGEMIINPQSTRLFEPILSAMNRTRGAQTSNTMSSINIGDITVNGSSNEGVSSDIVGLLTQKIKRARRRGLI